MGEKWNASLDQRRGICLVRIRVHRPVRAIVRGRARRPLVVGLGHPGSASLRGAVEHEFHAGDAEPVRIGALVLQAILEDRAGAREHGQVGIERLPLCGRSQCFHHLRARSPTVLYGGRPIAEIDADRRANQRVELVRRPRGPSAYEQAARALLEDAIGLHRTCDSTNEASVGVRSSGRDVAGCERRGIGGPEMPRHMTQHNRMLGRSSIQVEAGRMALLLEQRVVVPASGDDLTRRDLLLLDPALDLGHELVDVRDVTHRWGVQRQRVQSPPCPEEVTMGVDETGQQSPFP